jgi:pimeloyl-ACP methyl ester carboxylesterase
MLTIPPANGALQRRDFLRFTAAASAAVVAGSGSARAAAPALPAVKQVNAGVLNIGYLEYGPASGAPVLLFHGWPYDIHAFAEVAPILAAKGHRVIVPHLRGHGSTLFRAADTPRNGQQAALAADGIALMDALGIAQAVVAGFDWGARTADIMAVLWPQRCKALVSVSGYLIGSQAANAKPLAPAQELQWWYQYYFATERQGRLCCEHQCVQQADLAARFAGLGVRRYDFRPIGSLFRQSRSCRHRHPQLSLAIGSCAGREPI